MGFAFLELVQKADGEVILREGQSQSEAGQAQLDESQTLQERTTDSSDAAENDPLVRIRFSQAILDMLDADPISLAEIMIEAATRALAEQDDDDELGTGLDEDDARPRAGVLH